MTEIYKDGVDVGYMGDSRWWSDPTNIYSFRISELNSDYPDEYFKEDHVSEKVVANYCNNVIREYELMAGKRLDTIVEFGSGGGWFTREFHNRGYDIRGFDGSSQGVNKCHEKRLYKVDRFDFRNVMKPPTTKYDIALCTEVAGHIEPPFSAILVNNLINHSDVIWWSSEVPGFTKPHLHHPNEQPYKYWVNLFAFYGYSVAFLSEEISTACEGRGVCIFYNPKTFPEYADAR